MSIFMSTFQMKPLEKILIEKVRTNVCSQLIYLKFVECAITFNSIINFISNLIKIQNLKKNEVLLISLSYYISKIIEK